MEQEAVSCEVTGDELHFDERFDNFFSFSLAFFLSCAYSALGRSPKSQTGTVPSHRGDVGTWSWSLASGDAYHVPLHLVSRLKHRLDKLINPKTNLRT